MKLVQDIVTVLMVMLLMACEPGSVERSGFDLPVNDDASGMNRINVGFNAEALQLSGTITAGSGSILAEVVSPSGVVVLSARAVAPADLTIDTPVEVEPGEWIMRYYSFKGTGYIRLHLNVIR